MKGSKLKEIKLIFSLAVALVMLASLFTFNEGDVRFLTSAPNISKINVAGFVGAYLGWTMLFLMGLGAYSVPVFIILWGVNSYMAKEPKKAGIRVFGGIFLIAAVSSIFAMLSPGIPAYRFERGGIIGLAFSDFLMKYLGTAGTSIVIVVLLLLSVTVTTDFLIFPFVAWLFRRLKSSTVKMAAVFKGSAAKRPAASKAAPRLRAEPVVAVKKPEITRGIKREAPSRLAKPKKTVPEEKTEKGKKEAEEVSVKRPVPDDRPYDLPGSDLLDSPPPMGEREIKENFDENSRILEETLGDFGIEAKVVKVSKGPVITRYELEPAAGVKIHRITSLSDNIALAMKSVSVRVVAPIPGKGTVGVEVPNRKSALVYLKDILESKEYGESDSKLKLCLGKDISGSPIVADLDDMPHLLIAGATGSGKTVCVNSIITTLLFNASPSELKFLMVDPKRVELAAFNDLPHLLTPVITDSKKVSQALEWLINEMESRYELFAELGVRNIAGYNERVKAEKDLGVLPYIVVIIDELADLMLVAQQEVENMITRLAQLSRAVGIHIVIATQRPSVDVITGVIKANFPARISFKVASKVDSRTVLDMNGAEKLLGRGDMLFVEPGNPKPIRGQGGLVTDREINKLTAFIKTRRKPEYEDEIMKGQDKARFKKFEKDEIYTEALKVVLQTRQASVSMLQRRLGVGYTRAARLIDMMEDEGVVGPYQGSKPREILLESMDEEGVSR